MKVWIFILYLLFCSVSLAVDLTYQQSPIDNPLKGLASDYAVGGAGIRFPHSLMYGEIYLKSTVVASNTYDWSQFESMILIATNPANSWAPGVDQIVVRPQIDVPWTTNKIPQYLLDAGLWTTNYDITKGPLYSLSPDYTNGMLVDCLINFIAAFGAAYDGDPRIAFIELGCLGPWGEWDCDLWCQKGMPSGFIPLTTQQAVYYAYTNAFRKTKLMVRYPAGTNNSNYDVPIFCNVDMPFGEYDDGIAEYTIPPNMDPTNNKYIYWQGVMADCYNGQCWTNKWKKWPYGGEQGGYIACSNVFINPIDQPTMWAPQTWSNTVCTAHVTWCHNTAVFYTNSMPINVITNALAGAQMMGYELWAKSYLVWTNDSGVQCRVVMTNTGVAPFYYDWQMQVKALTNAVEFTTYNPTWQLTTVIPGDGDVNFDVTLTNIPAKDFTLLMRAVNPMANGKQLRFANTTMHATTTNWLTLGDVVYSDLTGSATRTNIHGKHSISGKFKLQ